MSHPQGRQTSWGTQAPPAYNYTNQTASDERAPLNSNKWPTQSAYLVVKRSYLCGLVIAIFTISFLLGNFSTQATLPESSAEWELERRQHQADRRLWDSERHRWDREAAQHVVQREAWAREREEIQTERAEIIERHKEIVRREGVLQHELTVFNRDRIQLEREKDEMSRTRVEYESERLVWDKQRAMWARDRDDWEKERQGREGFPHVYPAEAYWDTPVPSKQCHSYGKREYSARLWGIPSGWDWMEACKVTPVKIDGVMIYQADRCEDKGWWGGVVAHWIVEEEDSLCRPWFDVKQDQGCIGSSLRRHEAPILGIQRNDNWEVMCSTTPDVDYKRPTHCVNKPHTTHKTAVWDRFDVTC